MGIIQAEEYFKRLEAQYQKAYGKSKDKESFVEWLEKQNKLAENYLLLLDYLQVNYKSSKCLEIDKGQYDSVLLSKNYKSFVLSQYPSQSKRVIEGKLILENNQPFISYDLCGKQYLGPIDNYHWFLSQNPDNQSMLNILAKIHNDTPYNVVLGMYGQVGDLDYESKIDMLLDFMNQLKRPYDELHVRIKSYKYDIVCSRAPFCKKK